VSSDRADAALTIDGTNFGHPPALVFLTPGTHKVFITATNAPDKTRSVDVVEGQRASVEIHFTGSSPETVTSGPSPTVSASPAKASSSPTAPPVKASPKPKPSPQLMVQAKTLLETERKAKQSALAAERQRIQYEIAHSTGATREQWKYKLVLWHREEAQAEQDQAAAKARLSSSRGRSGTP
jgi:hypothetical protein